MAVGFGAFRIGGNSGLIGSFAGAQKDMDSLRDGLLPLPHQCENSRFVLRSSPPLKCVSTALIFHLNSRELLLPII